MDRDKDFGLFIGFKNMLLFYLAAVMLTAAFIGLYNLMEGLF